MEVKEARRGSVCDEATRVVVVHVPHWSVVASGADQDEVVAVVRANRVVAASAGARREGVSVGARRRQAQKICPQLEVIEHDPTRDARAFEAVAGAFDAITPQVEVSRPGTLAFATRGPSRYFGGDRSLAERTLWTAQGAVGAEVGVGVGVADGAFAGVLAAKRAAGRSLEGDAVCVVDPERSAQFLAPVTIQALSEVWFRPEVVDLWKRLGITSLGLLADLPSSDVLARFGYEGLMAHRLASGLDQWPLEARRPPPDMSITQELESPADRVDGVAFVVKAMADRLHAQLAAVGLACTHVLIEAETEHGESLARRWRHEGALSASAMADRVRWQLDGWLNGSASRRPSAGISRVSLVPLEVVQATGRQLGFWGGETLVDERVVRAVARVQSLIGAGSVTVPEVCGGRGPADRIQLVPVDAVDLASQRSRVSLGHVVEPWPGRVPTPAPASVVTEPEPVDLIDDAGTVLTVSGRAELSGTPHRLHSKTRPPRELIAWSGPWPCDERWWDRSRHRRVARVQVVTTEGEALLLVVEAGRWAVEATYS